MISLTNTLRKAVKLVSKMDLIAKVVVVAAMSLTSNLFTMSQYIYNIIYK